MNRDFIFPNGTTGIGKEMMAVLFVRGYAPTAYITKNGSFYGYGHDGVYIKGVASVEGATWSAYAKKSGKYKILTCTKVSMVNENRMTEETVQVGSGELITTITNPSDSSSYSAKIVIAL